jgi:hypothetical protein
MKRVVYAKRPIMRMVKSYAQVTIESPHTYLECGSKCAECEDSLTHCTICYSA